VPGLDAVMSTQYDSHAAGSTPLSSALGRSKLSVKRRSVGVGPGCARAAAECRSAGKPQTHTGVDAVTSTLNASQGAHAGGGGGAAPPPLNAGVVGVSGGGGAGGAAAAAGAASDRKTGGAAAGAAFAGAAAGGGASGLDGAHPMGPMEGLQGRRGR